MSRTHKTAPYHVKMNNPHKSGIHPVARHDHRRGVCDLPAKVDDYRPNGRTECFWTFTYTGTNECGCRLCTNYWQRLWDRRKDRKRARRELAQERNTAH